MKKSKRGFLLTETLIVSTFISATLLIIFSQFRVINQGFSQTFNYNNINDLYKVHNIKAFLNESFFDTEFATIDTNNILDITSCNPLQYSNADYCSKLYAALKVDQIILVPENLDIVSTALASSPAIKQDMYDFLDFLDHGTMGYRAIIRFENGRLASLNIF